MKGLSANSGCNMSQRLHSRDTQTNQMLASKFIFKPYAFLILLVLAVPIGTSCRRDTSNEKRYELKGKVLAVEKDKHLVTVAHEEIKDFMEPMTMPFMVRDDWAFDVLGVGDQITATLVVDSSESWLENIVITKGSPEPAGTGSPGALGAKPGDEVPDFALVNQNNQPIHTGQYRGKTLLLTFIYTRCPIPEYCTLMSNNFSQIERELQKQPEVQEKIQLLSISIDPDYDTPAVLRSYGAAHTGRYAEEKFRHWEFATGTKEQVKKVAQFFGLQYYPEKDQITHGLRTVVIGPNGKVASVYRGNEWKPAEVLEDLQKVVK